MNLFCTCAVLVLYLLHSFVLSFRMSQNMNVKSDRPAYKQATVPPVALPRVSERRHTHAFPHRRYAGRMGVGFLQWKTMIRATSFGIGWRSPLQAHTLQLPDLNRCLAGYSVVCRRLIGWFVCRTADRTKNPKSHQNGTT